MPRFVRYLLFFLYGKPKQRLPLLIKTSEYPEHVEMLNSGQEPGFSRQQSTRSHRSSRSQGNQNLVINQNHFYIQQVNVSGKNEQQREPEQEDEESAYYSR